MLAGSWFLALGFLFVPGTRLFALPQVHTRHVIVRHCPRFLVLSPELQAPGSRFTPGVRSLVPVLVYRPWFLVLGFKFQVPSSRPARDSSLLFPTPRFLAQGIRLQVLDSRFAPST